MISKDYGAPTRTRTADPLITNQVLYQLSYRGTVWWGALSVRLGGWQAAFSMPPALFSPLR